MFDTCRRIVSIKLDGVAQRYWFVWEDFVYGVCNCVG